MHLRTIKTRPKPIQIDLERTAVIVVDMQNCFLSKGGMFDLAGLDISRAREIVPRCKDVIDAARKSGCKVIYLRHSYNPDLSDSGGETSPNWYKELGPVFFRKHPDLKDKLNFEGTWGADIIEDLKPQEGDVVVRKQRFSGFAGTNLDMILKTYNIKYLVFIGIASNICVESTIRDAFSLDYFPILISDAVSEAGASFTQEATIYNVKFAFGWVIDSEEFCNSLR